MFFLDASSGQAAAEGHSSQQLTCPRAVEPQSGSCWHRSCLQCLQQRHSSTELPPLGCSLWLDDFVNLLRPADCFADGQGSPAEESLPAEFAASGQTGGTSPKQSLRACWRWLPSQTPPACRALHHTLADRWMLVDCHSGAVAAAGWHRLPLADPS